MATVAYASIIIPLPVDEVWDQLRDFTFPARMIPSVASVSIEGGVSGFCVGAVRKMLWESGELRKHRLIDLSDLRRSISWELVESDPPAETLASISHIRCMRVSETNQTFVEWTGSFASGTDGSYVLFEQRCFQRNLNDIRRALTKTAIPTLYHVLEGASIRVLWTAAHLGIPLAVKLIHPNEQLMESAASDGGVITKLVHGNTGIIESGAAVMHLIEAYDKSDSLIPSKRGSSERAQMLQWFFYSASTMDHLLWDVYKRMYVVSSPKRDDAAVRNLKQQWHKSVAPELERALEKSNAFMCGQFSAADIMCGWSVNFANTLGFLDEHPILQEYLKRLRSVPSFHKAFSGNLDTAPFYLV